MAVCVGRTQGIQIQKVLVQDLLQGHGGFHGIDAPFHSSWDCFFPSWKREQLLPLVLYLPEKLGAFVLLLSQLAEEAVHAFQGHLIAFKLETYREVGVGGCQK